MKVYCFLLLFLLFNNVVISRLLSKKKERTTYPSKIDEFYFGRFSPFKQGALIFSNFMVGLLSHFIDELDGAREIFLEFLNSESECSFELLKTKYNSIKLRNEIAVWKSVDECKKSIQNQKEYATKLVQRDIDTIVQVERLNKKTTNEEEIKENIKIAGELFIKLDQENKELIQKENYDCEKEFKTHSFSNKVYRKLKHLIMFYDEGLSSCFHHILNKQKKNDDLLYKIGKTLALRSINLLAKISPVFTIAKLGVLFIVLVKKTYDLVKIIKSIDYMEISFRLGKLTGVIVDMLSGGLLSR